MRISALPIGDPRWSAFVHSHPDAGPFHLPEWASVIADCYRFESFALTACDTDGEILAGIPVITVRSPLGGRRWVSLPFTDSCSPLIRADVATDHVLAAFTERAFASPIRGLEVRAMLPAGDNRHGVAVGYLHTMELPPDSAMLHPNKSHRNLRNRALRKGMRVVQGRTRQDMAAFYRLHTLTRRRLGVPVQPRRFFDLLWHRIVAAGHGFVASATLEGEVQSAAVMLIHNGVLINKYHGSDPSAPDRAGGYLIDWEMMVAGCNEGYHTLDLGRTDTGAEGLRRYKSLCGAVERPLIYTHISRTPPVAHHESSVSALSREIIRRSPPWVCRTLGEIFYRWAA
jgi:CelD/BcsL family acetyltransferase involved in cellulose biosynthesis